MSSTISDYFSKTTCMRLFTPSIVGSLLILGLALPPSALAGAGDLDPAFGVGGKVTTDFGFGLAGEDEATDVLKVKANKIVAVGWIFNPDNGTVDFALVRYDKHGNVDEKFGDNGKVITDFGGTNDVANAAAVDDQDRIIVVGSAETPFADCDPVDEELCPENEFKFAIARYNKDGSLDTSFGVGGDGMVTTSFPLVGTFADPTFAEAEDVAVDHDNKIIAVGAVAEGIFLDPDDLSQLISNPDFAIARYNEDGSLDASFDHDGRVVTNFWVDPLDEEVRSFDEAAAVVLAAARPPNRKAPYKIIAGGFSQAGEEAPTEEDFAVSRYNYDGSLDTSCDSDGLVTTDFDGLFDVVESLALMDALPGARPKGDSHQIVAAGITVVGDESTEEDFALVRYNDDCSIDTSFGAGGAFGEGDRRCHPEIRGYRGGWRSVQDCRGGGGRPTRPGGGRLRDRPLQRGRQPGYLLRGRRRRRRRQGPHRFSRSR
jgi:uncharacterized delta-60 repeat protein